MTVYEMEGFLRGKCLPGDLLVGESTAGYLVRKLNEATTLKAESDAQQKRADALAVENAAQGAALSLISGCYGLSPHIQSMCAAETPATYAALAAIEARGVEKFAEATIAIGEQDKEENIIYAGKQAMLFAKQLREAK